ncbi:MAG: flagellar basal body-associated FliL family protein [Thermoanaerobacteraceae bacterium]|nr:flagellar basal body-associated FliL family protein [Thermoanaerobacteraceae bacterium]
MKNIVNILLVILIIIVSGIAAYLYFFVMNNNTPSSQEVKNVIYYSPGDSFITNLKGSRRYIKVDIQIELNDKSLITELNKRNAEMRDEIYSTLRDSTAEEIDGAEGQDKLRQKLVNKLVQLFDTKAITNVYFTDFVVQ